jgi:hydroxymethylglutaryl-CoA lyase
VELPAAVEVVEVGPRDGLQSETAKLATADKVALIEALTAAGIKRFEATSFVSPTAIPQLADAEDVLTTLHETGVVYGGLIPNERGYERAKGAGAREVVLVCAATEGYSRANLKRPVDEVLDGFAHIAARGRTDGIRVRANVSTVFGDPFDGPTDPRQVLRVVARVVESGIEDVTLSDTIGVAHPRQVYEVFTTVREHHPDAMLAAHFHDTRGLALANVVAALEAGVTTFDASVGGLGGSPYAPGAGGNVATEDLVHMLTRMAIETDIDLGRLLDASELLEGLVGHALPARIDRNLLAEFSPSPSARTAS